jgi:hypothetical protein
VNELSLVQSLEVQKSNKRQRERFLKEQRENVENNSYEIPKQINVSDSERYCLILIHYVNFLRVESIPSINDMKMC